jgi:hypothetical protein
MPPWIWMFSAAAWKYAAELEARLREVGCHLETALGPTHLLGGEGRLGQGEDAPQRLRLIPGAHPHSGRPLESDPRELSRRVEGLHEGPREAVGVGLDPEEGETLRAAGHDEEHVGGMSVEHPGLRARELVAGVGLPGLHLYALEVPAAVGLCVGQAGRRSTRRDLGEQLLAGLLVGALEQSVGCEDGCTEIRRAEERAAHLLHHDQQLDVAETGAAVLFGDQQTGQTHLLGHLLPCLGVVAALGRHLLAHGGLVGPPLEEAANGGAELFVFVGEAEIE